MSVVSIVLLVVVGVAAVMVLGTMNRSGGVFGARHARDRERLESERDLTAYNTSRGGHRRDPPELRKPPHEGGLL